MLRRAKREITLIASLIQPVSNCKPSRKRMKDIQESSKLCLFKILMQGRRSMSSRASLIPKRERLKI